MDAAFSETEDEDDQADADYEVAATTSRTVRSAAPRVPELDEFLDSFDHSAETRRRLDSRRARTRRGIARGKTTDETELSLDNLDSDSAGRAGTRRRRNLRSPAARSSMVESDDVLAGGARRIPQSSTRRPAARCPRARSRGHRRNGRSTSGIWRARRSPSQSEEAAPISARRRNPIRAARSRRDASQSRTPSRRRSLTFGPEPAAVPVEPAPAAAMTPAVDVPLPSTAPAPEAIAASRRRSGTREGLRLVSPSQTPAAEVRARAERQASLDDRRAEGPAAAAGASAGAAATREPERLAGLPAARRAIRSSGPVPVPQPMPLPPPPPIRPAPVAMPAVPSFVPTPVGAMPQPVYPSSVQTTSAYGTPSAPAPAHPGPLTPTGAFSIPQPSGQVKVKAGAAVRLYTEARVARGTSARSRAPDRFGTLGLGRSDAVVDDEPRAFPWKLAAVAMAVAIIAIFIGTHVSAGTNRGRRANPARRSTSAAPPRRGDHRRPRPTTDSPIPAGPRAAGRHHASARYQGAARSQARRRNAAQARRAARPPHADVRDLRWRSHPERAGGRRQDRDARHPGVLGLGCRCSRRSCSRSPPTAEASDPPKRAA